MISRHILTNQRVTIFPVSAISESVIKNPCSVQPQLKRILVNGNFEKTRALATKNANSSSSHSVSAKSLLRAKTPDLEDKPYFPISKLPELSHLGPSINQHIRIDEELRKALRQILWHFKAPIRYAFVYGSGVFPQSDQKITLPSHTSIHTNAPFAVTKVQGDAPKMIDFIFGVSHTQHWHSLNLAQHRDHYSALGSLGSGAVSIVQDRFGAGVYFNPYVTVNGILIKYGVVNLDTLCTDLSEWTTLYLAGRLQKPVEILRDDPRVRLANQVNLLSALRVALLLLPSNFSEYELYSTICNISYIGDPRMTLPAENPSKVANIVGYNLPNFRRLYLPLLESLPNVCFNDLNFTGSSWISDPLINLRLVQDMDPVKRGNMVRRLPRAFRLKLYFQYQKKYQIPQLEFDETLEASNDEYSTRIKRFEGGGFERRMANEPPELLSNEIRGVIKSTVRWPSTSQSLKGVFTAGLAKTWRYIREKIAKNRQRVGEIAETRGK